MKESAVCDKQALGLRVDLVRFGYCGTCQSSDIILANSTTHLIS